MIRDFWIRELPACWAQAVVFSETAAATANINIAHEFFVVIVSSFASGGFVVIAAAGNVSPLSEVHADLLHQFLLSHLIKGSLYIGPQIRPNQRGLTRAFNGGDAVQERVVLRTVQKLPSLHEFLDKSASRTSRRALWNGLFV